MNRLAADSASPGGAFTTEKKELTSARPSGDAGQGDPASGTVVLGTGVSADHPAVPGVGIVDEWLAMAGEGAAPIGETSGESRGTLLAPSISATDIAGLRPVTAERLVPITTSPPAPGLANAYGSS